MGSFRTATLLAVAGTTSSMLFGCLGGETVSESPPNATVSESPPTASERFESRVTNLREKNIDALTQDYSPVSGGLEVYITTENLRTDGHSTGLFSGTCSKDFVRSNYLEPFVKCNASGPSSEPLVLVSKFDEGKGVGVIVFESPCTVISVETLVFSDAGIDLHLGYVAQSEPRAGRLLGMEQDPISDADMGCLDLPMTEKIIKASSNDNVTEMYSVEALLMFVDMRSATKQVKTFTGKSDIGKFFAAESSWLEFGRSGPTTGATYLENIITWSPTTGEQLEHKPWIKKFECVDFAKTSAWSDGSNIPWIWGASFHTDGLVLFQTIVAFNFTAAGAR